MGGNHAGPTVLLACVIASHVARLPPCQPWIDTLYFDPLMTSARPIVVTGVAGFIGSRLARRLARSDQRVVGCDNFITGCRDRVPPEIAFHEADCRDLGKMNAICAGASVVVHCAATAYEGLSVYSPHLIGEHVFGASSAVFSAAINQRVSRIVFVSSMARYGGGPVPFVESQLAKPVDPYGAAKLAAETLLATLCRLHGVEHVIAIPHNVVGPGQRYDDVYRNVAAIMINRVLSGADPVIYGDGMQRRCFTHVDDVVDQLTALVSADGVDGEIYNLGADTDFLTIHELARRICERIGRPFRPVHLPARVGEIRDAACSHAKIAALTGHSAARTLDEALAELISEVQAAGPLPLVPGLPIEIESDTLPSTWRAETPAAILCRR
jgi:UDP-glucose 4-epimerase